jgi:GTP-binding protein Era
MEVAMSARTGAGVPQLINEITTHLPEGEALYPEDWIVDQSIQNIAAEFVREKVLRFTNQEVPHSVAVEVDEWEDRGKAIYVRMTINVEKPNQKGILIGAGGSKLKHIGQIARGDIERLTERSVYLDLWVKVRRNWRNDVSSLGWLGYNPSQHQ